MSPAVLTDLIVPLKLNFIIQNGISGMEKNHLK